MKNDLSPKVVKCSRCGGKIYGDVISLTRDDMIESPPDILFTSTEMLNQRLADKDYWPLFGIGTEKKIKYVLLDEAHSYEGIHGAHSAYLLRRWQCIARSNPHYVGLSATLLDAKRFFSDLTSTDIADVELIEPQYDEYVKSGAEYFLALKGDPVDQTALLSTTIQAAMLIKRILDTNQEPVSKGIYGQKTLVFTDNLDVTNRLLHALGDAEGQKFRYGSLIPDPQSRVLAGLRGNIGGGYKLEDLIEYGQDWSICEDIGHVLGADERARIAITSSQNRGFDEDAEIVVTTASLELGYDDPTIGAVIQHKAPRGAAGFLQRKGRAGRSKRMRPWTILVLSDFGNDRLTYQRYERLAQPILNMGKSPMTNSYVLKIQAAQAVLDWFSLKLEGVKPWENIKGRSTDDMRQQMRISNLIDEVFANSDLQNQMTRYLSQALKANAETLIALLWQPPRSLMLEFLPSLQERIQTNWAVWNDVDGQEEKWSRQNDYRTGAPMPDFIPPALFSELNGNEINIILHGTNREPRIVPMPFFQALREFAPGNVSKRFSVESDFPDWLMPLEWDASASQIKFDISEAFGDKLTYVMTSFSTPHGKTYPKVFCPHEILTTQLIPSAHKVSETTKSQLIWGVYFDTSNSRIAHEIRVPRKSNWFEVIDNISTYTHSMLNPIELVRYSTGAKAGFKREGVTTNVNIGWVKSDSEVGIGTRLYVDAIRIEINLDDKMFKQVFDDSNMVLALRTQLFQDAIRTSGHFENTFVADWIFECVLAGITWEVARTNCSVETAVGRIGEDKWITPLGAIPMELFQTHRAEDGSEVEKRKLQVQLIELLEQRPIREEVQSIARLLYLTDLSSEVLCTNWLRGLFSATLAGIVNKSVIFLLRDCDENSINIDFEAATDENANNILIWITETQEGGCGFIDQLLEIIEESPNILFESMENSFRPSPSEIIDSDLRIILRDSLNGGPLSNSIAAVRKATTHNAIVESEKQLRVVLDKAGCTVSKELMAVIHTRILRPNTQIRHEQGIVDKLSFWEQQESACGFEIPLHIASSMLARRDNGFDKDPELNYQSACVIQGSLWIRGSHMRSEAIRFYNGFVGDTRVERLLGNALLVDRSARLDWRTSDDFSEELRSELMRTSRAVIDFNKAQLSDLSKYLVRLCQMTLEINGLEFFIKLDGITKSKTGYEVAVISTELSDIRFKEIDTQTDFGNSYRTFHLDHELARKSYVECLGPLLASAIISKETIWLLSPWVSDFACLDNRAGQWDALDANWPSEYILFSELLISALDGGAKINFVTRNDKTNSANGRDFCERLREATANPSNLILHIQNEDHRKGLLTPSFFFKGSANFTFSGTYRNGESVYLESEVVELARHANYFESRFEVKRG